LKAAGAAAKGATVYVTLEPCAHKGRAKSCSQALVDAGVSRVVGAITDPDPRTSGKGFALLEEAGVAVTTGVLADEAARAHSGHIARVTKGRPHVTLKLAVSADGMIGTRGGERMIITGQPAFDTVQTMRTTFDVVMIGSNTAKIDDPRLTVRLAGMEKLSPARVVLDSKAELPLESRLASTARDFPLIIVVGPEAPDDRKAALADAGARIVEIDAGPGGVDLKLTLEELAKQGFSRVLAEGGSEVAASLVSADLLDEVVIFRAPVVVGPEGVRALAGTALSAIERSPRYRVVETAVVGEDQMRRYVRTA
jgi:diaminohydroxyphosphoribosylaminopyrimidine deaminase/5-amino-6-(5-phosphoribosylamino)uracil reductase